MIEKIRVGVSVKKTGKDEASLDINHPGLGAHQIFRWPHIADFFTRNRHIVRQDLSRVYIDHPAVDQEGIGFHEFKFCFMPMA